MAKVTAKYQVTVPKAIADQYGIRPGGSIDWVPAGDVIRIIPGGRQTAPPDSALRLFDQATARQAKRNSAGKASQPRDRGWRREDLYRRGRAD
jgi:AbrB family looped-hinge helix DNA binding protein